MILIVISHFPCSMFVSFTLHKIIVAFVMNSRKCQCMRVNDQKKRLKWLHCKTTWTNVKRSALLSWRMKSRQLPSVSYFCCIMQHLTVNHHHFRAFLSSFTLVAWDLRVVLRYFFFASFVCASGAMSIYNSFNQQFKSDVNNYNNNFWCKRKWELPKGGVQDLFYYRYSVEIIIIEKFVANLNFSCAPLVLWAQCHWYYTNIVLTTGLY